MNNRILFALCFFFFQLSFTPVLAVKAYPYPIAITQPDGTQLTILLHGDEYHDFKTTEDGFLLKANAIGFLTYATKNTLGEIVESQFIAHDIDKRTPEDIEFLKTAPTQETYVVTTPQAARQKVKMQRLSTVAQRTFPRMGNVKTLVILVSFPDVNYVTPNPQTAFNNMFNAVGYSTNRGTGSVRDYFMASTYGKFAPSFDVVGPYILPNTQAYYGKDSLSSKDINIEQMVIDACTQAAANGIDFSQYDTDNDGYVDNVSIVYAGQSQAEGGSVSTIWPITSSLSNPAVSFNGKLISEFTCVSELKYGIGTTMTSVGVFCHEFGHVLGLPDYYNTYNANYTLDSWDIMDAGAYLNLSCTPPTYSAYDRFYLGYFTPQEINTTSNLTLLPIYQGKTTPSNTNNQAFLFSATAHNLNGKSPNPKEFFMVEYRKKTGWDSYLPAEGMLIWHIDYDQTAWDMNGVNSYTEQQQTPSSHMRVYLQPSSGSIITPGTAFKTGNFTPFLWAGTDINRAIAGITTTADSITFKFMPTRILTTGKCSRFFTPVGTPSDAQNINLAGYSLTGDVQVNLTTGINFEMKQLTDNAWSKNITLIPTNGLVNTTLQVRYNPYINGTQTDKLTISGAGVPDINFNLSGISIVPVNPPTIYINKIDKALCFDLTKVNTSDSKTLNIKTTYINSDLSVSLTGTDAAFFSTSAQANTIPKDIANSVDGFNISVSFKPIKPGHHTATLTISGGGLPDKIILLSGNGIKNSCDK